MFVRTVKVVVMFVRTEKVEFMFESSLNDICLLPREGSSYSPERSTFGRGTGR